MIFPVTVSTHQFGGALPRKITHRKKHICSEDRCSVYFHYIDNSLSIPGIKTCRTKMQRFKVVV
jgi:hypothetical protein